MTKYLIILTLLFSSNSLACGGVTEEPMEPIKILPIGSGLECWCSPLIPEKGKDDEDEPQSLT